MKSLFDEMSCCFEQGDSIYHPSKFWIELNRKNTAQLLEIGPENFKRTVALNYFTWVFGLGHDQVLHLARHTRLRDWPFILGGFFRYDNSSLLGMRIKNQYALFVRMLWRYAQRHDPEDFLGQLDEPLVGNPFRVMAGNRLISQDLANSVLEYYSVREHFAAARDDRFTVMEIGPGYGRNAHVFLSLHPNCRYILVDIPPALGVAQYYLSRVFPHRRVFPFRPFDSLDSVRAEMDESSIIFLLPHQAAMLPEKIVDLAMNISSFGEMTLAQIEAYFSLIDRTASGGQLYIKQWKESVNHLDRITVRESDYPIPPRWRCLYSRSTKAQPLFFEAMYSLPSS